MHDYNPLKDEIVVFDTNILIKQFYPVFFSQNSDIDDVFKKIRKENCRILLSSIQVSEFINRYIRIQFELYKKAQGDNSLDFKRGYRYTPDYKLQMDTILDIVTTDIIPICTCIDDQFEQMKPENLYIKGFSYDFNDALLVEIARLNEATIITNDHDILNYSYSGKIVTNNNLLLCTH